MRVSTSSKVRPAASPRTRKPPFNEDDDDDDELALFSSMPDPLADFEAIEREIDAQLAQIDPFGDEETVARALDALRAPPPADTDRETVVEAFVSHQPQYKSLLVAKKLQLYELQLQVRERELAALHEAHNKAVASIEELTKMVEAQQKEYDEAQDQWEEEKASLLRFRAGATNGPGANGALLFQMKMGASAAAMAARSRDRNEAESQQQRELRMQMLRGAADVQDQLDDFTMEPLTTTSSKETWLVGKKIRRWLMRRLYPFARDVRQIEARFGYSVASYFRFFRWIIMSFVAISIPSVVSLVLHVLVLKTLEQQEPVDWSSFVGIFPAFLLFPRYRPLEGMLYALVLLVMQALVLSFTIHKWIIEDRQFKTLEALDAGMRKPKFGRVVLNAWDFAVTTVEQASDLRKSIAEQIKVTQQEELLVETLRRRTRREWYKLYARRGAAFLLYLVIQAASWYLILLVTTQSSEIQVYIAKEANYLAPYVSSIVPALVTVINGVLPAIISLLTTLEKWDDIGFAIKAMVTRLYLAKVLNVLIQLVSYALLLDPYLFTGTETMFEVVQFYGPAVRKNVMLPFKPSMYTCRAEQVASGLLTLVATDFVVGKVAAVSLPGVTWTAKKIFFLWSRFLERRKARVATGKVSPIGTFDPDVAMEDTSTSNPLKESSSRPPSAAVQELRAEASMGVESTPSAIRRDIPASAAPLLTKTEFQVPQKMVALLYTCTITLVAIPLAPTAAILAVILHIANFKFDKMFLMHLQKKPTSPWSARDAGSFFIKFYLCTVVIFMVFTHFFLSNTHLPKQCKLQDALLPSSSADDDGHLCLPGLYDASTELCTLNPAKSRSIYFADTDSTNALKNECIIGYPKCICSLALACGPFTSSRNGYAPLLTNALSVRVVAAAYNVIASSVFVAWIFVLVTAMGIFFLRNSLGVQAILAHARESEVTVTFTSLRKKIKQLENRLRVHKIGNDDRLDEKAS